MAKLSGCYRWNDALIPPTLPITFTAPLYINGTLYTEAMIITAEDGTTLIALFDEDEMMYLVYSMESSWIKAVNILEDRPVLAKSDLWQTWDFGEGCAVSDSVYAYVTANATPVVSSDAINVTYEGKLIASLEGGQKATLQCKDKTMNDDVVISVPAVSKDASASLNVAFGTNPPDDTSKLWIKTPKPEAVSYKLDFDFVGNERYNPAICRLPNNVFHSTAAAMGSKIYIFGGGGSAVFTDRVHMYDTETNTVRQLGCTMPYAANGAAAATVGEKIYIFGGRGSSENADTWNRILIFDPATETFENISETLGVTLPEKRYLLAAAAVGKKIYLFGGSYKSTSGNETIRRYIYMFNTEGNSISQLSTNLTETTYGAAAVAVGTNIYIFGGSRASSNYMKTIGRFNTTNYEFKTLAAELPNTVYELTAAAVGTNIYVFGGLQTGGGTNTICRFDTLTETLEVLDETSAKSIYATPCAAIGSKIYVFDGYNGSADHNVNAFVVNIDLPENHVFVELSGSDNMFPLLPNMEIGVKNVYRGNAEGKGELVSAARYKDGLWYDIYTGVAPITFTIDGIPYSAESGMKWLDLITDTRYPTDNLYMDADNGNCVCVRNVGPIYHNDDKVLASDVIVHGAAYTTDNKVTFTIDDIPYTSEKGMTWAQWLESDYNTGSRFIQMESNVWDTQAQTYVCLPNGNPVATAAVITNGAAYILPV